MSVIMDVEMTLPVEKGLGSSQNLLYANLGRGKQPIIKRATCCYKTPLMYKIGSTISMFGTNSKCFRITFNREKLLPKVLPSFNLVFPNTHYIDLDL